jgi:hypothetical protein
LRLKIRTYLFRSDDMECRKPDARCVAGPVILPKSTVTVSAENATFIDRTPIVRNGRTVFIIPDPP